jgi:hypothetical protein
VACTGETAVHSVDEVQLIKAACVDPTLKVVAAAGL